MVTLMTSAYDRHRGIQPQATKTPVVPRGTLLKHCCQKILPSRAIGHFQVKKIKKGEECERLKLSSLYKESVIQCSESGIHRVEFRIQDCLGLLLLLHGVISRLFSFRNNKK